MRKFVVVNNRPKFSHVGSPGMNVGGWAKTSRGGLNEVDIIQKKGKAACSTRNSAPPYKSPRDARCRTRQRFTRDSVAIQNATLTTDHRPTANRLPVLHCQFEIFH